jgi:hypothetical protein
VIQGGQAVVEKLDVMVLWVQKVRKAMQAFQASAGMVSKVHLVIQVEMELRDERAFQVPKELMVDQEYPV